MRFRLQDMQSDSDDLVNVINIYDWTICRPAFCSSFLACVFFQAEDGIRDRDVTGVQTCALPIGTFLIADTAI